MFEVKYTFLSNCINTWCKATILTMLATLMMACSGSQPACPSLLEQLDNYMSQNDCKVYGVYFTFEEGITYITITGSHEYNKVLTDGYFYRNGKLVTYSFEDNNPQDDFIYRNNTESYTGDIKGYDCFDPYSEDHVFAEPPLPIHLVALSADSILSEDVAHVKVVRKHIVHGDNVIKHKAFNDSINSFINTTTGHMTMLRIAKKDGLFCYTIRSQNTYCKEHTRGYFLRDGHPIVIYLNENNMDLDITPLIDVNELKSCENGIENYRDYPDSFFFFSWGYKIVGDRIEILSREENEIPVL